jgi:spore coat protein CotH
MLRRRFRLISVLLALGALLLVSATGGVVARAQPPVTPIPVPTPVATPEPDPADSFFDDTVLHDINLTINDRDWDSLKINYLDNTTYPVSFGWNNEVVRNVGIRSRGLGSRSGIKPGLRVDFDYYATTQKFKGLKSVVLRNNTQDASNMRERVSMLFFRRLGLRASREAHARLFIKNQYAGVYTIVESLDKTFLKKNFLEDEGHLYEYRFDVAAPVPYAFEYRGADPALYTPLPFKPQTNESDPRGEFLERLFWTINEASDAVWRTAMEEFLDLRRFVRHVAVESFLADQDGLAGDYGPNNFYLYRYVNKNLFRFLPWDKSQAFWEAPGADYSIFRNIENGPETHRNRLVVRALRDPELRELYLNTLLECADSAVELPDPASDPPPASPELGWLEGEIKREYEQIREAVLLDPAKLTSNAEFEQAYRDMRSFARNRSDAVRAQVAAARARR